jgi:hypothetical protein
MLAPTSMRPLPLLLTSLAALSCAAPAFTSHRQDDGAYRLECKLPLPECLSHVDDICRGSPYDVVSAHDHRRPVDIAVGNVQSQSWASDAVVRCTTTPALFNFSAPPPPAPPPPPKPAPSCVPGATQACVGPGACTGGQACLPDGSGFGPCNCGAAAAPADAGAG